ncbi:hypothetical protein BHE74_00030398 [Ensete ventricosum]|nr:hypothetical protein BHE74_00030398 [Ensete ventricosum]
MLAVFDRTVAKSPEGLRNPEAEGGDAAGRRLVDHFAAAREGTVVINLGSAGALAYSSEKQNPLLPRWHQQASLFSHVFSFSVSSAGCFFTTSGGLQSFEHPLNELKAVPRVDSQGQVCGATYKVDDKSKKDTGMPRVGSAANWSSQF